MIRQVRRAASVIASHQVMAYRVGVLSAFSGVARAEAYPTKPVRSIIGFATGGALRPTATLINNCGGEAEGISEQPLWVAGKVDIQIYVVIVLPTRRMRAFDKLRAASS
jgi:hypothetical protein